MFFLVFTLEAHAVGVSSRPTFGFVDLLYWQVRESGADNWGQLATGTDDNTTYKVLDAPFDWNTGVRIGFGQEFNQNSFDLAFAYTHFQTTASSHASGTVISSFDGNYFANNTNGAALDLPYESANIRYQFYFNTIDLMIGKNYKVDSVIGFHPFLGLKLASIKQNIYSNWFNPIPATDFTTATENLQNNFNGLGPAIGVDSNWLLYDVSGKSIYLVGNLVSGLLYGHTTLSDVYGNNKPVTITVYNDSVNGVSPMIGGLLGLQWNYQFATSNLSLRLGYEGQIWFNQVQFYSLNMGKIIRPVSLQGGDIELSYHF
jgi:hypothetical protein